MGAWPFLSPHLAKLFGNEPEYVGRRQAAATAVAPTCRHGKEQARIIDAPSGWDNFYRGDAKALSETF